MAQTLDSFKNLQKLNKQIYRVFRNFRKPHSYISHGAKKIEVEIKLPGMTKRDVELQINPKNVIIKAEKNIRKKRRTNTMSMQNESYNGYFRKIPLSSGLDIHKSKARFSNGTLIIKIPKKKEVE